MLSNETINEIVSRLVSKFMLDKIILFGSHARGDADDRSDVDILTISEYEKDRLDVMREMTNSLNDLNYAFDVIVLKSDEYEVDRQIPGTIARYADKEGKVLYDGR